MEAAAQDGAGWRLKTGRWTPQGAIRHNSSTSVSRSDYRGSDYRYFESEPVFLSYDCCVGRCNTDSLMFENAALTGCEYDTLFNHFYVVLLLFYIMRFNADTKKFKFSQI